MELTQHRSENPKKHVTHAKFTPYEDELLTKMVSEYGTGNWAMVSKSFGNRSARQCRDRWNNYLSPNSNYSEWTPEEEKTLLRLYHELGPKWATISLYFNKRTNASIRAHALKLERQLNRNNNSLLKRQEESKVVQAEPVTVIQQCPKEKFLIPNISTFLSQIEINI